MSRRRIGPEALLRPAAERPGALVAVPALAVLLFLAAEDGGYAGTTWYPAGLVLMGLLAVVLWSRLPVPPPPRPVLASIGLLAAYALWSYASIAWADDQGSAWDGANRTALYAVVLALFALWPMGERPALAVLAGYGLGVAAIGLVELLRINDSANPISYFIGGRLSEPVGYPNGNAALWTMAAFACLAVAAQRHAPALLRGCSAGGAVLLGGLALLSQSRGWAFSLPVVAVVFIALYPGRARAAAALALAVGGVWLTKGAVLDVYDTVAEAESSAAAAREIGPALSDAVRVIVWSALGAGALGFLLAVADAGVRLSPESARRGNVALTAVAAALAIGGAALFVAREGSPFSYASGKWSEFKTEPRPEVRGGGRLGGTLGSNRYDFWRVAWGNFARHPLTGVGADNYQHDYLLRGESSEEPRFPHSLELRTLSQTGLVGALLLLGCVAMAGWTALAAVRRAPPLAAGVAAGALSVFAYWLVHGSVDWFFEFPGLAAPAFAMLGLASALAPRPAGRPPSGDPKELSVVWHRKAPARSPDGRRPVAGGPWPIALSGALLALAVSFALPWIAERDVDRAARQWGKDPEGAFSRLHRAAQLNSLSSRPALTAGVVAVNLGRLDRAERELRDALERDPRNAFAALELGAVLSRQGRREQAVELLERAVSLAPRDPIARRALRAARQGRRLDVVLLNRQVLERGRARLK